jgi:hypothetical protein
MVRKTPKIMVGALERCDLPNFLIENLQVRIDTGAKTSSLHVDNIKEFDKDGKLWISFDIHPDVHDVEKLVRKEAKVEAVRKIKSSSGEAESRYVVLTEIMLGNHRWTIELTLTNRSNMTYLMLLGREAMAGRIIVDPEKEFEVS